MATEGTIRQFFDSPSQRWDFPRIDDRTPASEEPEKVPRRAPRPVRWGVMAVLGLTAVAIGLMVVGVMSRSGVVTQVADTQGISAIAGAGESTALAELVVYVSGAVTRPGVISLSVGDRVHHAIEQAGGALPDADLSGINLARLVVDGEQLMVPRAGETPPAQSLTSPTQVSLSLATAEQLESLPGVGPALARRIIEWREKNGPFRQVDDVTAVDGIGPATLERFRHLAVP